MTHQTVDFTPPTDSLLRKPRLDHVVEFPLLGVGLRVETNSVYVRELLEQTFGMWRGVPDELVVRRDDPFRIRVIVTDGSEREPEGGRPALRYILYDDARYIVHTPGSVAMVDPERGDAAAYITAELASHRSFFRHSVLEAIGLSLAAHHDRHPIHASAVGRGDHVILLAGASGVGKSTLAYMAHSAGLDVLSDDTVWVQLHPEIRLWGWTRRIHLTPESERFFPELAALEPRQTDSTGKLVVELDPGGKARSFVRREGTVCIIERGGKSPSIERLERDDLIRALSTHLTQGYDRYPERLDATVHALARNGGWRLTLNDDPRNALPALLKLVDENR